MSLEDLTIDFDQSFFLITGSNGSGKTSILELVAWVLTGETSKKVSAANVVTHGHKSCSGTVVFTRRDVVTRQDRVFQVTRYRNHPKHKNNLYLTVDDEPILQGSLASVVQDRLFQFIGLSSDLFILATFFSQGACGVCSSGPTYLKDLLERLLNVNEFAMARALAKEDLKQLQHKKEDLQTTISRNDEFLRANQFAFDEYTAKKQTLQDQKYELQLLSVYASLLDLGHQVAKSNMARASNDPTYHSRSDDANGSFILDQRIQGLQAEIVRRKDSVRDLNCTKTTLHDRIQRSKKLVSQLRCPTCESPVDTVAHTNTLIEYDRELQKIDKNIDEQETKVRMAEAQLQDLVLRQRQQGEERERLMSTYRDKTSFYSTEYRYAQAIRSGLTRQISQTTDILATLESTTVLYDVAKKDKDGQVAELGRIDRQVEIAQFWYDGFDVLRSFALAEGIQAFNLLLGKYCKILTNETIHAWLDLKEDKKGNVKIEQFQVYARVRGVETELRGLSGGQQRKVDLAFGLAVSEFFHLETLFFDEWFDSLDSESVEVLINLLQSVANDGQENDSGDNADRSPYHPWDRLIVVCTHHERLDSTLRLGLDALCRTKILERS